MVSVPGADEVHVWSAPLLLGAERCATLARILSSDELARAGRFAIPQRREQFIVGHALLRIILGCYLGVEPESLQFATNRYGKPYLAPGSDGETIRFNMSDSNEIGLFAFTRNREVGVDIERIRPNVNIEGIARRFFFPAEYGAFCALPAELRRPAFFAAWTRKEAYVKAIGKGLYHPLRSFSVTLLPDEPHPRLEVPGDPAETRRWSLYNLSVAPEYAAAAVVEGADCRIVCRAWQE